MLSRCRSSRDGHNQSKISSCNVILGEMTVISLRKIWSCLMFKSKRRQIVIPQSEHLRLVGSLAMLWGNADFDLPPVEHVSMIAGMALHDRGYGQLDNSAI